MRKWKISLPGMGVALGILCWEAYKFSKEIRRKDLENRGKKDGERLREVNVKEVKKD